MGSLSNNPHPSVAPFIDDEREHRRQLSSVLGNAMLGKLNNTGSGTLTNGAVSTTVSDARVGPNSIIQLMPTSATAAVDLAGYSIRTRTKGSFTITHVSTSTADCTFGYAILG